MKLFIDKHCKYSLLIATDARNGLEQALGHDPDIILTDINLPDMTGWELSRRLRNQSLTKDTPIIAFTSLNSHRSYQASKDAGIDLHLNKTTRYEKLFEYVDNLLKNRAG